MNSVTLIGHLGNGPEIFNSNGVEYAKFSLATNESWTSNGERKERTDWHRITAWNGLAQSARHLAKGDRVAIRGRIRTSRYEKNGIQITSVEIDAQEIEFLNVQSFQTSKEPEAETKAATKTKSRKAKAA